MTVREDLQNLFMCTWESSSDFQAAWDRFVRRGDHTVVMIEPPLKVPQRWLMPHMNCFAYSLGLHELSAYHRWIREHHALYLLNGDFMQDLIEQQWLAEVDFGAPRFCKLVVYQRDDHVTHCGSIIDEQDRVRSKFSINEFYEHGLHEVQTSFGEPRCFLEPPTDELRRRIVEELDASARE